MILNLRPNVRIPNHLADVVSWAERSFTTQAEVEAWAEDSVTSMGAESATGRVCAELLFILREG